MSSALWGLRPAVPCDHELRIQRLRSQAVFLGEEIEALVPQGEERELAIFKLREAILWAEEGCSRLSANVLPMPRRPVRRDSTDALRREIRRLREDLAECREAGYAPEA